LTPYQKKPENFLLENLKKDIDMFFKIFDYVDQITLEGGEPLLHNGIIDIIKHILHHNDQLKQINIITNGTILPTVELLAVCNNKVFFIVDDYGPENSGKRNAITKLLEEYHIPYRIDIYHGNNQYYGGWVDFGDFREKKETGDELQKKVGQCHQAQNEPHVKNGRIFKCTIQAAGINYIPLLEGEFIELHDTSKSTEEKARIWEKIKSHPVNACNYCNGFITNGSRVPAGEQFNADELTADMKICFGKI
jgi:hypothetical protein